MSGFQSLLIASLTVTGLLQAEYTSQELPQLVADFELQHELLDRTGTPIVDGLVDNIVVVKVQGAQQISGAHKLVTYIDGKAVSSRADIRFPCSVSLSCKGLLNGSHEVVLAFTDTQDQLGLVRLNLTVQH